MNKALTFLLLAFLSATQATKHYSVGMNFRLNPEKTTCSEEMIDRAFRIALSALEAGGYNVPENEGNSWRTSQKWEGDSSRFRSLMEGGDRELFEAEGCGDQGMYCRKQTEFLCLNCPCCETFDRRRVLRNVSERRAQQVREAVETKAEELLNSQEAIGCLQYPPEVVCYLEEFTL